MVSDFWFCVKTYLKFEQRRHSCGVLLSPWGLSRETSRHAAPIHEAPFIFLSDMLSVMVQRGSILIVWTDHSRERGFDFGCWQNRHRLAELLWCLSCQFWHCTVLIVIGCLPRAALKLKARRCSTFHSGYCWGNLVTRQCYDAEMACYCSTPWICAQKSIQSNHDCQFLFDNLSGRYEQSYAGSLVTNKPLIYKRGSTVCLISVLNKTNRHLSCAVQALYEIGAYFNEA